jgi:hypothetical protein
MTIFKYMTRAIEGQSNPLQISKGGSENNRFQPHIISFDAKSSIQLEHGELPLMLQKKTLGKLNHL